MALVLFAALLILPLFAPIDPASALSPSSEINAAAKPTIPPTLVESGSWRLRLDVGVEPGTWMPKRHPGWGESGARLGVGVDVEFTSVPSPVRENLVGPKGSTFEVRVVRDDGGNGNDGRSRRSTFVSERGSQEVTFEGGGWCVRRPNANVRNGEGGLVRPEGLLRFWLDCPSGAKRNDVEIFPGTRLFFTAGLWEDASDVGKADKEYRRVLSELQEITDKTRDEKSKGGRNSFEELLWFREMVEISKEFDRLKAIKEDLERQLPPIGASVAKNGVQIAPKGSIVIKGNSIPDWLPGSEYLILGSFSPKASEDG